MQQVTIVLCLLVGASSVTLDQLQIGADASQRILRREPSTQGVPALLQTKEKSGVIDPQFEDGSFEEATIESIDGVDVITNLLKTGTTIQKRKADATSLPNWDVTGDVWLVPSEDPFGGAVKPNPNGRGYVPRDDGKALATPSGGGGVYLALNGEGASITQTVSGHNVGTRYQLSFECATKLGSTWKQNSLGEWNEKGPLAEIHLVGANSMNDTLAHCDADEVAAGRAKSEPDWCMDLREGWDSDFFMYKATQSDVTFTIKNAGPHDMADSSSFVDAFDITMCDDGGSPPTLIYDGGSPPVPVCQGL